MDGRLERWLFRFDRGRVSRRFRNLSVSSPRLCHDVSEDHVHDYTGEFMFLVPHDALNGNSEFGGACIARVEG